MHITTFASSLEDIKTCGKLDSCTEVLIESASLARLGKLSIDRVNQLANAAISSKLKPTLVWDILMTETDFKEALGSLDKIDLSLFKSIRVSDLGAAQWIRENLPDKKIQLICENGKHNLQALLAWQEYFGESLERFVLSIELPESTLLKYCREIKTPLEVLGAGRIEIFYSPRKLLSNHFEDEDQNLRYIEVLSSSEENHERNFPTVETTSGTLMYLDKDHFILDKTKNLQQAGLHTLRIDLRHLSQGESSATDIASYSKMVFDEDDPTWPHKTAATFFKSNKTDKQLKKRSDIESLKLDQDCLAEVISGEQGKFVLFKALRDFQVAPTMTLISPDNKQRKLEKVNFRDANRELTNNFQAEELFFSAWLPNAVNGALLINR